MEVLIVQMGKVASTAIAEALRRHGLEALQAHIGSPERLQQKLRIMTSEHVENDVAERMYIDYLQELRVTFLLSRLKIGNSDANLNVKVISLTRDPLSWYWSHFAQNYDHYQALLRNYVQYHHPDSEDFDPKGILDDVQQVMFRVLEDTSAPLDESGALPQLQSEADRLDPTGVVFSQLNRFLVPLRWFNEDFLPSTGVDVYAHQFNQFSIIQSGRIEILLLRYEDLVERSQDIASFVGIDSLELQRANVSEDKNIPLNIKYMQKRGYEAMPKDLIKRIYATRYAQHFGYSSEDVVQSR